MVPVGKRFKSENVSGIGIEWLSKKSSRICRSIANPKKFCDLMSAIAASTSARLRLLANSLHKYTGLIRTVSGHMSFHFKGSIQVSVIMSPSFLRILLLALSFLALMLQKSEGQFEEWCIADEQTPDDELQRAMDWACGKGGADCSKIQLNQPCYMPNTIRDHASYAFNNYYQKFKHKGATCYFNAAALITDLDPSVGVSPGNVPVYHGTNLKVIDRRVRLAELVLRFVICGLGVLAVVLVATDTQVKEIFSIRKKARFTDMKALVFLVVANGIAAAYSLIQGVRCVVGMVKGSVLFSKPIAWMMAYLTLSAVAAAAQSAAFAKLGQTDLQWMKICNMYGKFCNQVGEGIASAVLVSASMVVLSCISAFSLFRLYGGNKDAARW
ncbi:hypothetical protein SADUNF_Sadunf06G0011800 [Salix dunnii]|uniref:CASP-like protein n=1 Tax=Salix dunnii TaxID=1413687 RepID=A0A835K2I5_9ROSI|nr:hypothetical protein SADUNF_Sadunf06G0011800 [Salix dunnii]